MNAFADMNAAIVADPNFGVDAVWTPKGAVAGFSVRLVLEDDADQVAQLDGVNAKVMDRTVYALDIAAAAAVSPGRGPWKGDLITLDVGQPSQRAMPIIEKPVRDQLQLNWLLTLA